MSLSPDSLWDRLCWWVWVPRPPPLLVCPPCACAPSNTAPSPPPTVSEPPATHSSLEKPPSTAVLCSACGNVCKGEVVRVQNKYFHIKCFVCKGERASLACGPVPWPRGQWGLQPRFGAPQCPWKAHEIWDLGKSSKSRIFTQCCYLFNVACVTYGGDRETWLSGEGQRTGAGPRECPGPAAHSVRGFRCSGPSKVATWVPEPEGMRSLWVA